MEESKGGQMKRYSYEVREDILSYKESILPKTRKECMCKELEEKYCSECLWWHDEDICLHGIEFLLMKKRCKFRKF